MEIGIGTVLQALVKAFLAMLLSMLPILRVELSVAKMGIDILAVAAFLPPTLVVGL